MKRLNVVVTGPQAALSDSFISGVLRWGLNWGWRGSAGDTLFPKSGGIYPVVHGQGWRYKRKRTLASVCPSSNLLFVSQEYSLSTRLHLKLRVPTPGFFFFIFYYSCGEKVKKKNQIRKVCEVAEAKRYHALPGQFFPKESWFSQQILRWKSHQAMPWSLPLKKGKCRLFPPLIWSDLNPSSNEK